MSGSRGSACPMYAFASIRRHSGTSTGSRSRLIVAESPVTAKSTQGEKTDAAMGCSVSDRAASTGEKQRDPLRTNLRPQISVFLFARVKRKTHLQDRRERLERCTPARGDNLAQRLKIHGPRMLR